MVIEQAGSPSGGRQRVTILAVVRHKALFTQRVCSRRCACNVGEETGSRSRLEWTPSDYYGVSGEVRGDIRGEIRRRHST